MIPGPSAIPGGKGNAASSFPNSSLHANSAIPRIKLNLRSATPPKALTIPPKRTAKRARTSQTEQRHLPSDSESSELTPEPEDDDNDEAEEGAVTRRTMKKETGRVSLTRNETPTHMTAMGREREKTTTSGPAGRVRKRAVKLGEVERRRARDEKFGVGLGEGYSAPTPTRSNLAYSDYETRSNNEVVQGLPEAFFGQQVEDLAYGAGSPGTNIGVGIPRELVRGSLGEEDDEEMFISQLSSSEMGQQSQSSVHPSDSDDSMYDSDDASTSDDEVDEFGFPYPSASAFSSTAAAAADAPLVLMENWDGQFVLVQPRQERSRSRRRGSRGSRTAGSIGESTVLSTLDHQGLIIDPDAAEHEFDEDSDGSSWSGTSDEDEGDTTDSMEEDDMPVLDSPALQGLIEQQMADISMGIAVNGSSALHQETAHAGPSIVITDVTELQTMLPPTEPPSTLEPAGGPTQTPVIPQTPQPVMGTFHPITDDPAQHAVIDGSKTATKSPFTHRRRSRRDSNTSTTKGRKRKSKPFSPAIPSKAVLPKRARYSSIPGHPRYIAARRNAQDREDTPSDSEPGMVMDLEDMLETSALMHDYESASDPHFRFDRVPVSTYLQRNLLSSGGKDDEFSMPVYPYLSPKAGMRSGSMSETLAGPPGRILISPLLEPVVEHEDGMLSRKERRRARRSDMRLLEI